MSNQELREAGLDGLNIHRHEHYENWRARARVNAALTIVRDGNALTRALLGYSAERTPLSRERMAVARRARGQSKVIDEYFLNYFS